MPPLSEMEAKSTLRLNAQLIVKCVYESLDQPCKLCQQRRLPCSLKEKVLGPKTKESSEKLEWVETQRGQQPEGTAALVITGRPAGHQLVGPSPSTSVLPYTPTSFIPTTTELHHYALFETPPPIQWTENYGSIMPSYERFLSQPLPKHRQTIPFDWSLPQNLLDQNSFPFQSSLPAELSVEQSAGSIEHRNVALISAAQNDKELETVSFLQPVSQEPRPMCVNCRAYSGQISHTTTRVMPQCVYKPDALVCTACAARGYDYCWIEFSDLDPGRPRIKDTTRESSLPERETIIVVRDDVQDIDGTEIEQ